MTPPCPFCDVENPPADHVARCRKVAERRIQAWKSAKASEAALEAEFAKWVQP